MIYDKISGFSDEISSDIKVQFEALMRPGIKYFEPRGINGKNISELTEAEAKELKALADSFGIKASSIGSPIGKIKVSDTFAPHFDTFKRVVETAKILDTKYIRIFSFYHDGSVWTAEERDTVFERLSALLDHAEKNGVILLHENEKEIYGDTAERCKEIMEKLFCGSFKAVFDPANFVQSGVDTQKAFESLKPYIGYMHIKDAEPDGRVVPSGMGAGNLGYILKSLFENGYDGFLSLEPHLGSFDGLKGLELDIDTENMPKGGEGTFTIAYNALCAILKNI